MNSLVDKKCRQARVYTYLSTESLHIVLLTRRLLLRLFLVGHGEIIWVVKCASEGQSIFSHYVFTGRILRFVLTIRTPKLNERGTLKLNLNGFTRS